MKKILIGNVITGDEKLFLQFELEKKKYGIEKLFSATAMSNDILQPSKNSNMKVEYEIADDYNEAIIKMDNTARIGITLTNFMNKIDKIYPILNQYWNLIKDFNISKMQELYNNIEIIIQNFNLKQYKLNYNVSEALLEIHQLMASKDDEELKSCKQLIQKISQEVKPDKELLYILEFIKKIFNLKNNNYNYYSYADLIWVTAEIIDENKDTIHQNYNFLLLELLKKLELKLKANVNEALKALISQIFRNFYNDYRQASNPEKLFEFLTTAKKNMENNPYNNYYKNIYKYIASIQLESISRKYNKEYDKTKRFEKFSLQEMSKIFVKTLLEDINYISNNYNTVPNTISNTIILSKNVYKYEISSFYELFYISRYYIKEDGNNLTKCNLCGKYFITQGKITEQHCRRIYKEDLNCCEYTIKYFKETNSYKAETSNKLNKIRSMLKKRDVSHKTNEFNEFTKRYEKIKDEINSKNINQEDKDKEILNWIRLEHTNLKINK